MEASQLEEQQRIPSEIRNQHLVTMRSFVQPEATMKARIVAQQQCLHVIDVDWDHRAAHRRFAI
jgi:hypothetical protein